MRTWEMLASNSGVFSSLSLCLMLQHTDPGLTWDADDDRRKRVLQKKWVLKSCLDISIGIPLQVCLLGCIWLCMPSNA
jgi:hypothetical protein